MFNHNALLVSGINKLFKEFRKEHLMSLRREINVYYYLYSKEQGFVVTRSSDKFLGKIL